MIPKTNASEKNNRGLILFSLLAFIPIIPILWGFTSSEDEVWTAFLLAIPYIIQLIIWFYVWKKIYEEGIGSLLKVFCFLFCFSIVPYSIAWVFYNKNHNKERMVNYGDWYSGICLIFMLGLVVVLLYLTYLLMHPEKSLLKNFTKDFKKLHFIALMHFFAIFLSITFLGGFALVFHDRANGNKALYMEKLQFDEILKQEPDPADYANATCLYFDKPTSNSEGAILEFRVDEPPSSMSGTTQHPIETRKYKNHVNLTKIINYIQKMYENDKRKVPRILIIGKADPNPVKNGGSFLNNYQLSDARIKNARYELEEGLSKIQYPLLEEIIWQERAVSYNIGITLFKTNRLNHCDYIGEDKDSNERVVEIEVKSFVNSVSKEKSNPKTEPLKVLDYMYFSIYTITTTGYGDIKPATPYAKFICSLENIIELFFLVIFVNVLISFKDSDVVSETADEKDVTSDSADEEKIAS